MVLELLLLVSFGRPPDLGIAVLDVGLLLPLLPSRYHHGEYIYIYYTRLYCKIVTNRSVVIVSKLAFFGK